MMKGQVSIENIILVGIVLAILVPSILIFYKSMATPEAEKGEIVSIGNNLITEIKNLQVSGDGSWQTVTFTYRGGNGDIYTQNGNELIIHADQSYPFFLKKDENIVIEEDLKLKSGKNRIKLTNQDGIVCISSIAGTCDYALCKDTDMDGYSRRGKGACCGTSQTQTCADVPDCNDDDPQINPGMTELCNRIDDNCDGRTDELYDADYDGYPADTFAVQCSPSYVQSELDCDDANPLIHPGATEVCDGIDNDCDGTIDGSLSASCADVGYLGWCAGGTAYCSSGNWNCDRSPSDEQCNDNAYVDEDCDGYANEMDPDCWALFFADYDVSAGGVNAWLFADICKGDCEPDETVNTVQMSGINNTSVSIGQNAKLRYTADHNIKLAEGTLQFWIRSDSQNIWKDHQSHGLFLVKTQTDPNNHNQVFLYKGADDKLWLKYNDGISETTWEIRGTIALKEDHWHFFTLTWSTITNQLRFYVNTNEYAVDLAPQSWPMQLEYFYVGTDADPAGVPFDFAQARFDNILISNKVKSPDQIAEEYERTRWDYNGECYASGGLGDINDNGCMDGEDKVSVYAYVTDQENFPNEKVACMDIDQDRHVNMTDHDLMHPGYCADCETPINTCWIYGGGTNPFYCTAEAIWTQNCQLCGCPDTFPDCDNSGYCLSQPGQSPLILKNNNFYSQDSPPGNG